NAGAAAQNHVVFGSEAIGKSCARVELLHGIVQDRSGKRFELITQTVVQGEAVGRAPLVLNVETGVGVADGSFSLVADSRGDALPLKDSWAEGGLGEIRRPKTFEEEHLRRSRLQAKRALAGEHAPKIGFKGVEERKRFRGVDVIEIAPEADCMSA